MPEAHPRPELGQARLGGRRHRLERDAQPPGGPPHQRRVTGRVGRRQPQQPPGRRRHGVQLAAETVFDPAGQRHRPGKPEPARQLPGRQPARQLDQGQRVAPGLGHDLVAHPLVQRRGQHRAEQRPRVVLPQAGHGEFAQSGQVRAWDAGPEHHGDRVGRQPPHRERQRLRRGPVQPLLVVDQADQRPVPGRLRQQAQGREADQEPVRRRPGGLAERGPQGLPLRRRQPVQPAQHRRAQLVQPGEGQLHLRLHARRANQLASCRVPGQVVEQCGLAHPRFPVHHQDLAPAGPDPVHQPVQHGALAPPARQPRQDRLLAESTLRGDSNVQPSNRKCQDAFLAGAGQAPGRLR